MVKRFVKCGAVSLTSTAKMPRIEINDPNRVFPDTYYTFTADITQLTQNKRKTATIYKLRETEETKP